MDMRRKLFIILAIYLSQLLFAPIIHCFSELSERDCADCCTGVVINSSCDNTNGPCKNPAHHHHHNHRHDPAQCTFCKSLNKDIEYVPIYYKISLNRLTIVDNKTHKHSATLLRGIYLIRAPPLKNFLT